MSSLKSSSRWSRLEPIFAEYDVKVGLSVGSDGVALQKEVSKLKWAALINTFNNSLFTKRGRSLKLYVSVSVKKFSHEVIMF